MPFHYDVTPKLLDDMVKAIVDEVHPEKVILFGSRARGDYRGDSDLDFVVVGKAAFGPGHSRLAESGKLYRKLGRFPVPADVLVYSADEFAQWSGSRNHVLGRATREGRVLYERG